MCGGSSSFYYSINSFYLPQLCRHTVKRNLFECVFLSGGRYSRQSGGLFMFFKFQIQLDIEVQIIQHSFLCKGVKKKEKLGLKL
jgi:hypothetical protein